MGQKWKWIGWTALSLVLASAALAIIFTSNKEKETEEEEPATTVKILSIMLPLHQAQEPPRSLIQEIESRTGYKLSIQWIPDDIYSTKMMNVLESKNSGQAVFVKPTDLATVKNAIRSGLFWNIGPYVDYYPNLKLLNADNRIPFQVDGKVYGLTNERPESSQGVIIRKDWLERLALQEPKTIEDLYKVMKAFTADDPDGNGKADTIGLADRGDLYYGAFKTLSSYFGTPNGWKLDGGNFIPEFETPEYMATMDFMKKLYNENLINKDFPVTSKSVQRFTFITGKAGVYVGSLADAPRLLDETRQVSPDAAFTVLNRIEGPKGYGVWSISGSSGMFMFSKRNIKNEEQLKQALAFFDRTMDKDVSNLLMYGMEKVHYLLKDEKASVPTSDMYRKYNAEVTPLKTLMIGNISNPNLYKRDPEGTDPFLLMVNEKIADNSSILIENPAANLASDTFDARNVELNSIISNATYNYILGKLDRQGFLSETALWRERGGDLVIQELQQSYAQNKPK